MVKCVNPHSENCVRGRSTKRGKWAKRTEKCRMELEENKWRLATLGRHKSRLAESNKLIGLNLLHKNAAVQTASKSKHKVNKILYCTISATNSYSSSWHRQSVILPLSPWWFWHADNFQKHIYKAHLIADVESNIWETWENTFVHIILVSWFMSHAYTYVPIVLSF
jgi:hypothetical protein